MNDAIDRPGPPPIVTPRLHLVPATTRSLEADILGPSHLGAALGVPVPSSWPPDEYDHRAARRIRQGLIATAPGTEAFWGYYFVLLAPPLLVGVGGFKGPPSGGEVELGYSIVRDHQRQGLATEAVRGMLGFAFMQPDVARVSARTLVPLVASRKVLERCGFERVDPGGPDGAIRYSIERAAWASRASR